jgi:peptidoglycan/LPS O-acetylase OafA/YrhL
MPMFFLGMIAFTNRRFLDSLSILSIPGLIVFGILYWAIWTVGEDLPRNLERTLYWLIRGGLSVFVISSIIWFFKKYANKPGKALSFAVDSAYSFYLFHFTFIYLAAWLSRLYTDNLYVAYLTVLLVATPATLLWHAFVIDRVPLLRFLFTGKRTRRAAPAAPPAPAA